MFKANLTRVTDLNATEIVEIVDDVIGIFSEKLDCNNHVNEQAFIVRFEGFNDVFHSWKMPKELV